MNMATCRICERTIEPSESVYPVQSGGFCCETCHKSIQDDPQREIEDESVHGDFRQSLILHQGKSGSMRIDYCGNNGRL